MLLGLAWHNTVVEEGQVVIKTAVIPSMNSSWAGTRRGKSKGWTDREGTIKKGRQTRAAGVKRGDGGEHYMLGPRGSLAQSAGRASERMC